MVNCSEFFKKFFVVLPFTIYHLLFTVSSVWACAVCFGEGNSDLQRGFYWGILMLLLLPLAILSVVGGKIVASSRKKTSSK